MLKKSAGGSADDLGMAMTNVLFMCLARGGGLNLCPERPVCNVRSEVATLKGNRSHEPIGLALGLG